MIEDTLVFMRTHVITKGVLSEFLKLKKSSGYECILFIDNHKKIVDSPSGIQKLKLLDYDEEFRCFVFDTDVFKLLNLPLYANKNKNKSLSNVMWHCADYAFYVIKKYFPYYNYYWQLDYDVFFNGNSYKEFFIKYENSDADLIIDRFQKVGHKSGWTILDKSDWIYKDVIKYKSFFPVSRISSNAIGFLYLKRLEHKKIFADLYKNKENRWINCELFVPTELSNQGFKCISIDDQHLRFEPNYDLNEDRIFEKIDNKIYHPVKGNYENRLNSLKAQIDVFRHHSFSFFGYRVGFFIEKKR